MPQFWYNDGSGLRLVKEFYYNDGTAVRKIKEGWYNDGAAVRKFFVGGDINSSFAAWDAFGTSSPGTAASGTLTFKSDGSVTGSGLNINSTAPGSGNWFTPTTTGIGSGYWIRATATSGSITTGVMNSWLQLSSNASWTKNATSGAGSVVITFEIATDAGGSNIVLTSTGNVL